MHRSSGGGPDWWVTDAGRPPIGPVSTELLLRGIAAGKVPRGALICAVGSRMWKSLRDTPPFSSAFSGAITTTTLNPTDLVAADEYGQRRMDSQRPLTPFADLADERTLVDHPAFDVPTTQDTLPPEDRTVVDDRSPLDDPGRRSG